MSGSPSGLSSGVPRPPLLFLDVDGPLIPFGGSPRTYAYASPGAVHASPGSGANPLLDRINPDHGRRLAELPCDLAWATTWMEDANDCVAPRLGLPRLPVVAWPERSDADPVDERIGLHAKTRALVAWAAGRAFAWVDDEITDIDRMWIAAHHPGPALARRVDATRGLTDDDFATLDAWLRRSVRNSAPSSTG